MSLQLENCTILTQIIENLNESRKILDDERTGLINKTLAQILIEKSDDLNEYKDLMKSILKLVISDINIANRQDYGRKYLKLLYDEKEYTDLVPESISMYQQFPEDTLPLGKFLKLYFELYFILCLIYDM